MVRKKYTGEQIIAVLEEGEAGAKVAGLRRKYGMSDATCYNWKAKYAGRTVSELKRLNYLEEENRRLKKIVEEQALDMRALKELLSKERCRRGESGDAVIAGGKRALAHGFRNRQHRHRATLPRSSYRR